MRISDCGLKGEAVHFGAQELLVIAIIGLMVLAGLAGLVAVIYLICKAAQKPKPPPQE